MKYSNCYKIITETDYFIYFFIGGRGIGKTYSTLLGALNDNKVMMYVRRTEEETNTTSKPLTNPFKKINMNTGKKINIRPFEKYSIILDEEDKDNPILKGYVCALSTFGKFRGADFSDVDIIIFDEFINTGAVDYLRGKAASYLFNMIETVNRNRELEGQEPIKVVLLSNANTIDEDIIRTLNLATEIQQMKMNDIKLFTDSDRGIYLSLLENKEVADAKAQTKLYKLTQGTTFSEMALANEFTSDYFGDVKKLNYNELVPFCSYEKIYFYKHKSKNLFLASYRKANTEHFEEHQKAVFKRQYGYTIASAMETGTLFYLNYGIKLEIINIFKYNK